MRKISKKLFFLLLVLFSVSSFAEKGPKPDFQSWLDLMGKGKLTDRLHLFLQFNPRFSQNLSRFGFHLMRGSLDYDLPKNFQIGGGYTWAQNHLKPKTSDDEQRLHQEVTHHGKWGNVSVTNRARMEERFFEGRSASHMVGRLRYLSRVQVPLDYMENVSAVAWDEVWFNVNSVAQGSQAGFDMNWAFMGVNLKVNKAIQMEMGYMLAYVHHKKKRDNLNHVMVLAMSFNF